MPASMPASPAGPPTPPVALAGLLALEELDLRLIAGPADAELLWVHASEMADPYPYLLGGELLLSAGVLLTDPDTYVARLVEAGAAALGFGVRPVHDTVPPALVAACERHGLPLVEVGPGTPFTAIARAVWGLMAAARDRELRRVARAQQALAAAAARPDPIPAVLHQLAVRLPGRAALLTAGGEELHAAGRPPVPEVRAALARLARVLAPDTRPAPASATDTVGAAHLSAYALGGGQGLALTLATDHREPGDHTVAGIAVVLLSLLAAPHQGADAAARSAALVRLLLGADPADVAPLLDGDGRWTVVHARRGDGGAADPLTAGALGAALGSALVDADPEGDTARVLVPGDGRITPQPGWTLGASAPAAADALEAADTRAARALGRAEATRAPLVVDAPVSGLAALLPPGPAGDRARELLAPLTAPLAETLRCWLSLHGNWDRTAVALSVHRNTVRQRIARCGVLLGADLDDMDVRTELWLALRQE
ncbi:PucR family transcriptional regulator [Streptomyces poriferorum]|uniref:PucR family transcriptional regulator n=2 Tax=Streptomyces poriferorum TaxID=2798799 RepID=A0ABY9IY35_9ACTN|nr:MULTISPECIES: PucR family transcriptional regulator [unclassified Streptomyces]MDP5312041.1 PucR family transcriptional regulator [Streptomyces sp. Alt4]WLQ58902.1 PucR family transcriptional regulator [Streptomyces sp. Alt2]